MPDTFRIDRGTGTSSGGLMPGQDWIKGHPVGAPFLLARLRQVMMT